MKDILKIALGIILGVLGLAACSICAFLIISMGGIALLNSSLKISTPPTRFTPLTIGIMPTSASTSITIPVMPTSTSTPIPILQEGEQVNWHGLSLTVTRSELTNTCPGGFGQPAEGAKFIIVYVALHNTSDNIVELPSMNFEFNGYRSGLGAGGDCLYDEKSFGNVCWKSDGKLYPDVSCEGWELFEIPEKLTTENKTVIIEIDDVETGLIRLAEWLVKTK